MFWRFSQRLSEETTKVLECVRTVYKMKTAIYFLAQPLGSPRSRPFFQSGVDPLGEFSWSRLTDCKLLAARS